MASTVTELRKLPSMRSIRSQGTITVTGNYATGGEAITLPKPYTTKSPYFVEVQSRNGSLIAWDNVNQKLKFFSAVGTEKGNAVAYTAAELADVIDFNAEFPKFG